jgi:tripartite-type tricarboxylate transporter receptor subunit TctC
MLHWLLRTFTMLGIAAASHFAAVDCAAAQSPVSAAEFFHGKTIRLVVPSGPGGAYGLYALLLAAHFGHHLPGEPTVVPDYRAGAGGVVAANYLYSVAPRDGSVIGIPLAPIILGQYTGGASVRYDAAKFIWIGQLADITRLLAVWHDSKIKRFDDLKTYDSIAGTTGKGSETFINPAIINHVFGTKIKIVAGYKGSASLMLALERGEINIVSGTWSNFAANHADWVKQGKVRFLVQIGLSKLSNFPNLPLLADLAKNEQDRQLIEFMSLVTTAIGYSVMAPPGVPDAIVAALRQAFADTMKDPAFIADAKKRRVDLTPADYKSVEAAARKAINSPPVLFQRFMRAIGSQ